MKKSIFRKAALERLSSPDQLDELVQVTTPKGWLALIGVGILVIAAVVWGIYGVVPTRVSGSGIIIRTGGVQRLLSLGSGQIAEVKVKVGDILEEGQVVARISQPELGKQIENTKDALDELLALKEFLPVLQLEHNHQTKAGGTDLQDVLSLRQRISQTQREIQRLEEKMALTSQVTSAYTGRVLELMVDMGSFVAVGDAILSVELMDAAAIEELQSGGRVSPSLEVVIYVSAIDGKMVRPGMDVQINPSTVKQEEFGALLATVKSVSDFPATARGMMRVLENETLVQQLSAGIALIEIHAELLPSSDTFSGYKWSSSRGPEIPIYSGTLCTATITIREQRPISLVFPMFKKKLRL